MFRESLTCLVSDSRCRALVVFFAMVITGTGPWAGYDYRCADFEDMYPVWNLPSSVTEASSGGQIDYLSLATDGAVIVSRSSERNEVRASRINDGTPLWLFETEGEVNSLPLIADGMVFLGSDDGYLYALDERTGYLIWKFDGRKEKVDVEKVAEKGKSLFGGFSLKKLKEAAEVVATKERQPNDLRARPAIVKRVLAMYVPLCRMVALDYETGEKLWETEILAGKEPWFSSLYPGQLYSLPIGEIKHDDKRFYLGFGGVFSLEPKTGVKKTLWPVGNEEESKRYVNWPVCDITITDGLIVAAVVDSGVVGIGKEGEGLLWRLEPSQLAGTYRTIYTDGEDGFALVENKGIVSFDVKSGSMKWVAEQEGAEKIWIGSKQVYIIYEGHRIKSVTRESGDFVWDEDFSGSGVQRLSMCRGALVFGSEEPEHNLKILCTEPRVIRAIHTSYGLAFEEGQPAQAVRKVLESGYPRRTPNTVLTDRAADELTGTSLAAKSKSVYHGWYIQSQEISGDSAQVEVAVKKTAELINGIERPLLEPKWEIRTFHLLHENGNWLVCLPLPDSCEVATSQLCPLSLDTPGIEAHPSGSSRNHWPFTATPGDHWKFRSWVGGDLGEPVSVDGEGHFVVKSCHVSENKEYIWALKQTYWAHTPGFEDAWEEIDQMEQTIRIELGMDSMRIVIPEHKGISKIKIPLPLKEGYTYTTSDGVKTEVTIEEDPELGTVSKVSFRDEGRQFSTEFTFSKQKGIVGWKRDFGIGATRWDWSLVDSRTW